MTQVADGDDAASVTSLAQRAERGQPQVQPRARATSPALERGPARAGRRPRPGGAPVSCRKTSSRVGPRSARSLTRIPSRRSSAAASSISSRPSRGAGIVSRSGRSSGSGSPQPTRVSASSSELALGGVRELDLEDLAADALLELVARARGDHPAVVDHRDPLGELIGLLQVLGGQQQRGAPALEVSDRMPRSGCGCAGRARWSARRGRGSGAASAGSRHRSSRRRIPPE